MKQPVPDVIRDACRSEEAGAGDRHARVCEEVDGRVGLSLQWLQQMRLAITAVILGILTTALAEDAPSLRELVRSGVDAVRANADDEKIESIFPSANQRPWAEFKQLIETVDKGTELEQGVTSALVGYSPYLEKALAIYHNHKTPEVRLCVLSAAVERFTVEGRKLGAEHVKELRELAESDDAIIAARGLLGLMVATSPNDPQYDRMRERIHKRLTEITDPDSVAKDLIKYFEKGPLEPPKGEQDSADQPGSAPKPKPQASERPKSEAETRQR